MQRGRGHQGNLDTSSKNKETAIRPDAASSSRQEETHTSQGFWDQCLEEVGDRAPRNQKDKTMAQELQAKHKRLELEKRKQTTAP